MERTSEMGVMKINKLIFGRLVQDAVGLTGGKAFSASDKGKILSGIGGSRPAPGEIADNLVVREEGDGSLYLELYIIMSFGSSIQKATGQILDSLEEELKAMFPGQGGQIVLKIVGVKSRQTAPRNIEVKRVWN